MKNMILCREETLHQLPEIENTVIVKDPSQFFRHSHLGELELDETSKVIIEPPHTIYERVTWDLMVNLLYTRHNIPAYQFLILVSELTHSKKKYQTGIHDPAGHLDVMHKAHNMLVHYFFYDDLESLLTVTIDFLETESPQTFLTGDNQYEIEESIIS